MAADAAAPSRSPRQEARRDIPLWGREDPGHTQAVTREQIEETLNDPNGAYQRLRRVMDAWAALWFWPLTDTGGATPPTLDQWIEGMPGAARPRARGAQEQPRHDTTGRGSNWEDLNDGRGTQPRTSPGRQMSSRFSRATRGSRSAKRSPSSRASSTGNSTSRRSSRGAASICNSATRRGCGHRQTWTRCSPRAIRGGSWLSSQARRPATARRSQDSGSSRESAISSSSATADVVVTRNISVPRRLIRYCRTAAGPLSMLHGADMEACFPQAGSSP